MSLFIFTLGTGFYSVALSCSVPTNMIRGSHGGEYEGGCLLTIVPYSLVDVYWRFRGTCYADDGGSKYLWNAGEHSPQYMALKLSRQASLCLLIVHFCFKINGLFS
jgi:hypothetical protein